MRIKPAIALLTTGLIVASLVGCSSAKPQAQGKLAPIKVLDYYSSEPSNTSINNILTKCAADLGTTIQRQTATFGGLNSKILQQASSKTLADVIMVNNPDVQLIAATGALVPLNEFGINASGFIKGIVDAGSYKGKLYGLAPGVNTIALFYNKKLLSAAGLQPPKTWVDLVAAAHKLTKGETYGAAFSAIATGESTWQWLPFLWSGSGNETDVSSKQGRAALSLWKDMVDQKSVSAAVVNWSQGDVSDQFKAGKAAMMINGPWEIPSLASTEGLDFGVVPIPVPAAGDTSVVPLGGETWTVARTGNKVQQAASAKMVACLTSDKNQITMAGVQDYIPSKMALAAEFVKAQPQLAGFVPLVQAGRALTGELGAKYPQAATAISTAIQSSLTGQASVDEALRQAAGVIGAK